MRLMGDLAGKEEVDISLMEKYGLCEISRMRRESSFSLLMYIHKKVDAIGDP